MSIDQLDEYEQGEQVRNWLRQNGSSLITGIALGLACIAGYKWWLAQQDGKRFAAAAQYQSFQTAMNAKDFPKRQAESAALQKNFPKSAYVTMAQFQDAAHLQAEGKPDQALKLLESMTAQNGDPAFAELVGLHIARLQVILGKPDAAVQRLDAVKGTVFLAEAAEVRGDAELARGNREAARKAYEDALTHLDAGEQLRSVLELKLIDAGGKPAHSEI